MIAGAEYASMVVRHTLTVSRCPASSGSDRALMVGSHTVAPGA